MAKFETVPLAELKTHVPAKLQPLVDEYEDKLEKLAADQGGRLVLEKGDDPKDLRQALKAAAAALNRRIRLPFRRGWRGQLLPREAQGAEAKGRGGSRAQEAGAAEEERDVG